MSGIFAVEGGIGGGTDVADGGGALDKGRGGEGGPESREEALDAGGGGAWLRLRDGEDSARGRGGGCRVGGAGRRAGGSDRGGGEAATAVEAVIHELGHDGGLIAVEGCGPVKVRLSRLGYIPPNDGGFRVSVP